MNSDWERILAIDETTGDGVILNFSNYKEFVVFFSVNGFTESNYVPMSIFNNFADGVVFGSSYYYNTGVYGYASIQIAKSGYYVVGFGVNANSAGSSISVWAR